MDENTDTPKKYIRTLAGDMEILKKGGVPDLTPLAESKSSPAERLVAASPVSPLPATEQTPAPEQNPPAISPPAPPPEPVATPIETYAGDFSDRMKETNASSATVLAAEQDAAPLAYQPPPQSARSGLLYILIGSVLLVASGFGVYFAYTRYVVSRAPVILAPVVSAPIFVDEREQLSGSGPTLLQTIEQSVSRPLASGTIRLLYIDGATDSASSPQATTGNIFSALHLPAPDILLRNINTAGSMAGVVNSDGAQSPFFILSVAAYSDTFSGMLSWEPTMPRDLEGLFPPYATSTASSSIVVAGFHDETIANHDVRVYRDAANRSVFLYGYWNQTTLIIARDAGVFSELAQRLSTSRTP